MLKFEEIKRRCSHRGKNRGRDFLVFRNTSRIRAKGVELEAEAKLPAGYDGRLSYSFQQTKDMVTGKILSNSAKHLAKLNLNVPLFRDKVFLGLEEQFSSRRKTISGNNARAYYLTNVTLYSRDLLKNLEASVSVYNLFDYRYGDPGGEEHLQDVIEQDGRTFRFKLTYRYN